jgi:hypothetical protein
VLGRDADDETADDRQVPEDGRQGRHREVVVGVQDPDDDARQPEQDDDREQSTREADGEVDVPARVAEEAQDVRREKDEQRRQRAEPEQHQPEQRRGDPPGAAPVAPLEELAEHRDERAGERGVRHERTHEVRDLEGDREGVDPAPAAEVVRGDALADETEHPGEPGRDREDRGRARQPGPGALGRVAAGNGRLADLAHGLSFGTLPSPTCATLTIRIEAGEEERWPPRAVGSARHGRTRREDRAR